MTEVRLRLFIAAGLTIALAAAMRFEGLLLWFPLGLWSCWRWRALGQSRGRLAARRLSCAGAGPALAALAWLAWLPGCSAADWFRAQPLVLARGWMEWLVAPLCGQSCRPQSDTAPIPGADLPGTYAGNLSAHRVEGPDAAVCRAAGRGHCRLAAIVAASDHAALVVAGGILLLAMWVHLWAGHSSCKRYVFPWS